MSKHLDSPLQNVLESPEGDKSEVRRRWRVVVRNVALALVAGSILGFMLIRNLRSDGSTSESDELLVHIVRLEDFEAFVTESGEVESSSNVDIRCQVKSEGGGSTFILDIIEEGTIVKENDFLLQFDDSALKLSLTQQDITLATDDQAVIEAQSELDKAIYTLNEYRDGLFLVEKETIEGEVLQAESNLTTAKDLLGHSLRLFRKGYVSRLQLQAQEVAVETAKKAVKVSELKMKVHTDSTYPRMMSEYESEIKKRRAGLKAAQFTTELTKQRRVEIQNQIEKCRVLAPAAGQVVYANDFEREQNIVIEEGAQVREGQVVIRLPNPNEMHVRARVNDSKIKKIRVDNTVYIELDVNPDLPVRGAVSKINPFPYPRRWFGGPIEYGTEIRILDPPAKLTPGQRAKVKILVEKLSDVIQVPIQSVLERSGIHYCVVRNLNGGWETRKVSIGADNGSFVVVNSGVDEGEKVSLNPDLLWDQVSPKAGTSKQLAKRSAD